MFVLFLAYANDSNSPLPELQDEDNRVYRSLVNGALDQHFIIHRDSFATVEKIREFLILYRDHIFLFSYSGHAGRDRLVLDQEEAHAGGLAKLLGRCPNLQVVLLNGCSTQGQVQNLINEGVPCVIATSSPVGDTAAREFGVSFFQSLSQGETINDAFEAASGAALLSKKEIKIDRRMMTRGEGGNDDALWGIYSKEGALLSAKLPRKKVLEQPVNFEPNTVLITRLVEALKGQSDELDSLVAKEAQGKSVSESRKRMAVLNSLPAPIAEHLRKLMVPILDENEGYDKAGKSRLQQLIRSSQVTSELIAFTLMAQLWEAKIKHPDLIIPLEQSKVINEFLTRSFDRSKAYDYITLIRAVRLILDEEHNATLVSYFVPELEVIKELPYHNDEFMAATFFLQTIRQRLSSGALTDEECVSLCARTEECLGEIFSHLGFLAKYQLAAVNNIDIIKYRNTVKPSFRHSVVRLIDLLGGLEQSVIELDRFTDNRSVLLLREDKGLSELNLTPFIIDKNAFEKNTDVSNIYFFSHFDPGSDTYFYYYVNNPDDEYLSVSSKEYKVIKDQMDAFRSVLKQN